MSKRRVKLPGRFAEDDNWYVVRFLDNEVSCPLKQGQIEDIETGETGLERSFNLKEKVQAPWIDGVMYEGVIEFKSERKEDCLKYKETALKTKKKNKGQKSEKKQKTQRETQKKQEDHNIDLLKKKKKENNEKKKKTESARQQTSIEEAEELFRKSLTSHVSSNNKSNDVTDTLNTSVSFSVNSLDSSDSETASSHTFTSQPAPSHTFPSQSAPSHTFPSQSAPSHTFPSHSAPLHTFPSQPAPSHTFSSQSAPSNTFPSHYAPSHTYPPLSTPSQTFPSHSAPSHTFPPQSAPSHTFPSKSPPSHTFPSQSASSHTFPSHSIPSCTFPSQSASPHAFPFLPGMPTASFPSTCTYSIPSTGISSLVSQSVTCSYPLPRPSYEAISPGKFSPSNSEACNPTSYFSSMPSRYSSPFSSYPPVLYPIYGHRPPNSLFSPLPEDSTASAHSMELLNRSRSSDPLPVPPCDSPVSVELDVCNDSPRNTCSINTAQSPEIPTPRPTSFLSTLSDNGCGECVLKDNDLQSSREYQRQLENDLTYWKTKAKGLQAELDSLKGQEAMGKNVNSSTFHYKPKRGTVVETCPYVFSESLDNVPRGYVRLVEGHDLFVDSKWVGAIKGIFRGKTKSHCFKLLMNGFYEPEDFLQKTAMIILQTPLGQALKGYAVTTLGLDNVEIVKAFNSKIGTMSRAVKKNRVVRENNE